MRGGVPSGVLFDKMKQGFFSVQMGEVVVLDSNAAAILAEY